MLIVFEGLDCAGKTTQLPLIEKFLNKHGHKTYVTYQPNNDLHIRDILLEPKNNISAQTELFLYLADKSHTFDSVIKPKLEQGYTVISDRYTYSTIAYQGYGRNLPIGLVTKLADLSVQYIKPNIVIYLDIFPKEVYRRQYKKSDRMEKNGIEFYERVRAGYLTLANDPSWIIVNGALEFSEVEKEICQKLMLKL